MALTTLYDPKYEIVPPAQRTDGVVWLDVNTRIGLNGKPDLVPEVQAINNSLFNLIRCPIGTRGAIFQPTYGTLLYQFLHEPCDFITGNKIKISLIQAIQFWEPRIVLDMSRTSVVPDFTQGAFNINVAYSLISPQLQGNAQFILRQNA